MSTKWVSFVEGARCVGEQGGACAAVAPAPAVVPATPAAPAAPAAAAGESTVPVSAVSGRWWW